MINPKIINYPGILRAFNKIEEKQEFDNKTEILLILSSMIDRIIQKDLECVRFHCETLSKNIISDKEISELLKKLDESNIVLYESVSNEQALIIKKRYQVISNKKI